MRKELRTRTPEQKKAIEDYIKGHGFKSINSFAIALGTDRQNIWTATSGRQNLNIESLLRWAKVLKCPVDDLIALFYPFEWMNYISSDRELYDSRKTTI